MGRRRQGLHHLQAWLASGLFLWASAALGANADGAAAERGLVGGRWAWDGFSPAADAGVLVPKHPEKYWVEFLPEGKLSLQADCNRGFGTWREEPTGVELKPLGTTLMACGEASLDGHFLEVLRTSSASRDGVRLLLRGPLGVLRLAEVSTEGRLTETAWTLVKVEDRAAATPMKPGRYGVQFLPGGVLRWTAECQTGGGTWRTAQGGALTLHASAGATSAACVAGTSGPNLSHLLNTVEGLSFADGELLLEGPSGRLRFRSAPRPP
jgi:META domain